MATGIIIGRFQPITKAHYSMIKDALKVHDEVYVVVVNSKPSILGNTRRRMRVKGHNISKEGDLESWKKRRKEGRLSKSYSYKGLEREQEKNPFSGAYRKKLIYKAMKGQLDKNNIISYPLADIVKIIEKVKQNSDDDTFYIVAGTDRVSKYQPAIDSAYEKGYFDKDLRVRVHEVHRDEEDADTIRATNVRKAIINKDIDTFEKLTPSGIHDEFDKMRKNLLTEDTDRVFKKVLNEMVHIEDLDVEEFIDFVKNIYQTEASIKLDGTIALGFGFDEKGFFTGLGRNFRQIKPEKRKYSVEDWLSENHIKVNAAVSAHKLLEENKDTLSDLVQDEEVILCEVLFGDKPNSIKYDFGGVNHLVVLNNNAVADALKGKHTIAVDNLVIEGEDNIVRKTINQTWKIGKTPTVDPSNYQVDIEAELQELQDFLNAETEGQKNFDILKMRAAGKKKELVQSVRQQAKDLKINIKQKLLKDFVRNVKGGEYSPSEGFSHEGIVLKKGNKRTKIIDKSVFTQIHDRDWEPINAANKIKKEMSSEDAIAEINKMIKNFDTLYPDIDEMTKRRMIENLKMTKIELRDLQ